jgi:DNA-directed RNA polymerase specialized sigma24 family protein
MEKDKIRDMIDKAALCADIAINKALEVVKASAVVETVPADKEVKAEIAAYVETLPRKQRNVFVMSKIGGGAARKLKNSEIAILMGISEKSVEKYITKTLSGLRKRLIEEGYLPELFIGWL